MCAVRRARHVSTDDLLARRQQAEDPAALRAELYSRVESVRGSLAPLHKFQIEELIDPRDTRAIVSDWAEHAYDVLRRAPLGPRPSGFRP
jgi:propionyl-CoA carboxylase beta chain